MFKCEHCACCCRNLNKSQIYDFLNRGDGVCRYLKGKDCTIYENRPLLCRIDESYNMFFKDKISLEKFYSLNKQICKKLKEEEED